MYLMLSSLVYGVLVHAVNTWGSCCNLISAISLCERPVPDITTLKGNVGTLCYPLSCMGFLVHAVTTWGSCCHLINTISLCEMAVLDITTL